MIGSVVVLPFVFCDPSRKLIEFSRNGLGMHLGPCQLLQMPMMLLRKQESLVSEFSQSTRCHQLVLKHNLIFTRRSAWDVLKNEYLAYQKHIIALSEPVASSSRSAQSQSNPPEGFVPRDTPHVTQESVLANQPEIYDQPSTFPKGCLAFVTNIHPETNRTTLKALFSLPFSGSSDGGGIDYVDFQKGMDSVGSTLNAFTGFHIISYTPHIVPCPPPNSCSRPYIRVLLQIKRRRPIQRTRFSGFTS
jgi:hypothetical protein